MEGSPPDRPADCRLLEHVASQNCALDESAEVPVGAAANTRVGTLMLSDVVMAILDRRVSCPKAGPGSVTAVTFAARDLGPDLRAAFAGRQVVILR